MYLCLAGQRQPGHNYRHQSSRIQTSLFGLPCFLVSGMGNSETGMIRDLACCTWPYHLSCGLRRTAVKSSLPGFCSSEAVGISFRSSVPKIQRIIVRSLRRSCCSLGLFGPHVSLLWSIIAQIVPLSFLAAIAHKPRQVRWGELHAPVVSEWPPACLHK